MKIYRPVKTSILAQGFGENLSCVKLDASGKVIWPYIVKGVANGVCGAGWTPFYTAAIGMKGHNGWDHQTYHGEPVYFPVDVPGVEWLASTEVDKDGGIGVNVRSMQPIPLDHLPPQAKGSLNLIKRQYDKLGGKVYLYFKFWHLKAPNVYDKKPVKLGDLIGWADSTGASSGDHLHWSMKVSDETSWFALDGDNGYTGALDFSDWYVNQFVADVLTPNPLTLSEKMFIVAAELESKGDMDYKTVRRFANLLKALGY